MKRESQLSMSLVAAWTTAPPDWHRFSPSCPASASAETLIGLDEVVCAAPAWIPLPIDPGLVLHPIALVDLAMSSCGRGPRTVPVRRTASASLAPAADPVDFSDWESLRVLRAAARAVAYELGREAAREYFAELMCRSTVS